MIGAALLGVGAQSGAAAGESIHHVEVPTMDGGTQSLREYEGKVLLIVNTASRCGYTGQYEGLQELHERYAEQGFSVLGFPSNSFFQELASDEKVAEFCEGVFGVSFPLFSMVDVRGRGIHPLFAHLTSRETNPQHAGGITWNFNKFLVDRNGYVVNRFGTRVSPTAEQVVGAIEAELAR